MVKTANTCDCCGIKCSHRNNIRLVCHYAFFNENQSLTEFALDNSHYLYDIENKVWRGVI